MQDVMWFGFLGACAASLFWIEVVIWICRTNTHRED